MCYLSSVLGISDIAKLCVSYTSRVSSKKPSFNGSTDKKCGGFSCRIRLVYVLTVKQNCLKTVCFSRAPNDQTTSQNKNKNKQKRAERN